MSLNTGQIPDYWRMAYVIPVYKRGDIYSTETNRPVSMTSICSKVIKHILFSNIKQHLDKNTDSAESTHAKLS